MEEDMMLKTFTVSLLSIAMSVGVAQAKGHMHKPMMMSACIEGQQATAICACGTPATPGARPTVCQKGQWCRSAMHACTQ
jgi:hypothetical protein